MVKRKLGVDGDSWIEKCVPQSLEDLAVQKKKISEVEDWIRSCFKVQRKSPILLLTGPPGAGKTITVTLLCKALKAEVFSWSNSESEKTQNVNDFSIFNNESNWINRESQVSQFSSFLLRCNKYSLFSEDRKVIHVEEFPNAFLRDPSVFHDILKKYLTVGRHPLIFVISDDTKGESIENRLFPADLKFVLRVTNISFNPITQAKLLKVLNQINDSIQFESRYTKLTKSQLEDIATSSMGDIRNAINSIQFLSLSNFKKPKPLTKTKANSSSLKEKPQEAQRDSSLFLFHALGKILYCKRDKSLKSDKDILPSHMKHLERDPTLANAEDVFSRTSLSADAFSLFLHENYLPFILDVKVAADCSSWFSEADVFSTFWNGQDKLNDYMASLASRGLMFNLTYTTGNSWRPLHKPQYYDCFKKQTSLMAALRRTFRDKTLSFTELQTEMIPFMKKIKSANLRPDQSGVISEIAEMKVKRILRPQYMPLKEKEVPDLEIEDFEATLDSSENKNDSVNLLENSDEEIIIEEYDF